MAAMWANRAIQRFVVHDAERPQDADPADWPAFANAMTRIFYATRRRWVLFQARPPQGFARFVDVDPQRSEGKMWANLLRAQDESSFIPVFTRDFRRKSTCPWRDSNPQPFLRGCLK